ncbi:hypothetical protein Q8F55_004236 [Vanrija albida]|uniref:Zn(2)-C6 fungal-type domain-containing protein n=1 Tax=Vanrija albida TaxID=181172 RepID=A0ABR3Q663_9TREE
MSSDASSSSSKRKAPVYTYWQPHKRSKGTEPKAPERHLSPVSVVDLSETEEAGISGRPRLEGTPDTGQPRSADAAPPSNRLGAVIPNLTQREQDLLLDWTGLHRLIEKYKETGVEADLAIKHVLPLERQRRIFGEAFPHGHISALYVKNDFSQIRLQAEELTKDLTFPKRATIKKGIFSALQALAVTPTINDPACQGEKCKRYACLDSGDNGCTSCLLEGKKCKPHKTLGYKGIKDLEKANEDRARAIQERDRALQERDGAISSLEEANEAIKKLKEERTKELFGINPLHGVIEVPSKNVGSAVTGRGKAMEEHGGASPRQDKLVEKVKRLREERDKAIMERDNAIMERDDKGRIIKGLLATARTSVGGSGERDKGVRDPEQTDDEIKRLTSARDKALEDRDKAIAQHKLELQNELRKIEERLREIRENLNSGA